ncbi:LysR family transcriptional regulator ArgP [Demequina sediminicola]|uniref:LysR family transcriptional regulator ArgP n=1 Tax=Demequina sediminicola TaxID=1095026 RepID=UPI0007807953|nr:LysR family transcriptional regulator ArgP [Demequina sediminicola]
MKVPVDLALTLAAAVEEGTLDAAARKLHLTQSAVSQRLATLERLTGQVLLVRSRPVRSTAAGDRIIRYARQVAHLDADLAHSIGLDDTSTPMPLAVNADSLAAWILPTLCAEAAERGILLELHREDEGHTSHLLADGTVAAAVTTDAEPVPGCSVTPLGSLRYQAVAAPEFARRWFPDGPTPQAISAAPAVDFDSKDVIQNRYLAALGLNPTDTPRHLVPSSTEFAQAIALGLGWGLLPAVQREGHELISLGGPDITVTLYWQQWRTHSATLAALAHAVRTAAHAHLEPLKAEGAA